MFRRFTKKRTIAALSVVAALAVAGGAYAFFTSDGSGSGTGSVGSSANYKVDVSLGSTALVPAGPTNSVGVVVKNQGTGSQRITSLVPTTLTADKPGCSTAFSSGATNDTSKDFYVAPITVPAGTTLAPTGAPGDTFSANTTIQMNDTGVSQDNCQGATLTLTYKAS
jgi:hypothetical protein